MNVYFISTWLHTMTLYIFVELYLKYLLYYQITIVILLHGINKTIN